MPRTHLDILPLKAFLPPGNSDTKEDKAARSRFLLTLYSQQIPYYKWTYPGTDEKHSNSPGKTLYLNQMKVIFNGYKNLAKRKQIEGAETLGDVFIQLLTKKVDPYQMKETQSNFYELIKKQLERILFLLKGELQVSVENTIKGLVACLPDNLEHWNTCSTGLHEGMEHMVYDLQYRKKIDINEKKVLADLRRKTVLLIIPETKHLNRPLIPHRRMAVIRHLNKNGLNIPVTSELKDRFTHYSKLSNQQQKHYAEQFFLRYNRSAIINRFVVEYHVMWRSWVAKGGKLHGYLETDFNEEKNQDFFPVLSNLLRPFTEELGVKGKEIFAEKNNELCLPEKPVFLTSLKTLIEKYLIRMGYIFPKISFREISSRQEFQQSFMFYSRLSPAIMDSLFKEHDLNERDLNILAEELLKRNNVGILFANKQLDVLLFRPQNKNSRSFLQLITGKPRGTKKCAEAIYSLWGKERKDLSLDAKENRQNDTKETLCSKRGWLAIPLILSFCHFIWEACGPYAYAVLTVGVVVWNVVDSKQIIRKNIEKTLRQACDDIIGLDSVEEFRPLLRCMLHDHLSEIEKLSSPAELKKLKDTSEMKRLTDTLTSFLNAKTLGERGKHGWILHHFNSQILLEHFKAHLETNSPIELKTLLFTFVSQSGHSVYPSLLCWLAKLAEDKNFLPTTALQNSLYHITVSVKPGFLSIFSDTLVEEVECSSDDIPLKALYHIAQSCHKGSPLSLFILSTNGRKFLGGLFRSKIKDRVATDRFLSKVAALPSTLEGRTQFLQECNEIKISNGVGIQVAPS